MDETELDEAIPDTEGNDQMAGYLDMDKNKLDE